MEKQSTIIAVLNTLIQMMVAIILFNIWYFALSTIHKDIRLPLHILFSATGYLLLMTQSLAVLSQNNSWSRFLSRNKQKLIHLILNGVGATCILVGFVLIVTHETVHFKTIHGIFGLIGFITTLISVMGGTVAYFGRRLGNAIRMTPVKFGHTLLGSITITMGLVTLCIGLNKDLFVTSYDQSLAVCLTVMTTFVWAYSLIQPMMNLKVYADNMTTTAL